MSRSVLTVLATSLLVGACTTEEATNGLPLREPGAEAGSDAGDGSEGASDASTTPSEPEDAGTKKDAGGEPQGPTESGEATYYNAEGLGSCGVPFPSDYLVAAMNDEQYQKAYCGKCVSVTGPKGTVIVRILDLCPGCDSGDLDLSVTAFTKIADKSAGRVPITWYFVDCPF